MGTNIAIKEEAFNKASDKSWLGTRMGLRDMRSITLDISTFDAEHIADGYIASGIALGEITASGKYGPYEPGGTATNEIQSVTVDATGGTFDLTFDGETVAAVPFDVAAATLQASLEALSNLDPGDVVVTGGPGDDGGTTPYVFTFGGNRAGVDLPAFITDASLLTGGAGTAVVAEDQKGGVITGAASDGRQNFAGLLFEEVKVEALTDPDVGAALFWTGVVKKSKLPSYTGTGDGKGEVDAAAEASDAGKKIRWEA